MSVRPPVSAADQTIPHTGHPPHPPHVAIPSGETGRLHVHPTGHVDVGTNDWWLMVRKFAKHGTKIATVAPSSRFLSRRMLKGIDWDNVKCIVELGAGTGPVTKEILRLVKPHTKFFVIEIDPDFCQRLRARFPTLDIVEGNANELDQLLTSRGITQVDTIISGLPLPSFPPELCNSIMQSCAKCLGPNGIFRQLTVMPYYFWRFYKKYFEEVKFALVPLNVPPAGVYVCKRFKDQPAAVEA